MELGQIIKLLLQKKGLTQKELARQIGKTPTSVSQIVSGDYNPNPDTLKRIATVLDVPVPILHLLTMSEEDVPRERRETFRNIYPALVETLATLFGEDHVKKYQ